MNRTAWALRFTQTDQPRVGRWRRYLALTLATGALLDDAALPVSLVAEWRADESNSDKRFPSYARLLPQRGTPKGESRYSWTADFAARRVKVRDDMQPLLDGAAKIKAEVVDLKERLKRLKNNKAGKKALAALEEQIREKDKAARELESQAAALDAAVFDLKAVNPNAVTVVDQRTPLEILANIDAQGPIVSEALGRLKDLLVADSLRAAK